MRKERGPSRQNLSITFPNSNGYEAFIVRPSDCTSGLPHHYIYESPYGSDHVTGTCKLCGHERSDWTAGDPAADWLNAKGKWAS